MSQKQQYDEAKQRLYDDSIRSYWTPDRIRCAKVEDVPLRETIPGKNEQAYDLVDGPPQCTEIDDKTRKDPPYNNVGLLYIQKGDKHYMATAYVVKLEGKNNIVFTAAHNLYSDKGKAEKIMFIPACPTNYDDIKKELGCFPQLNGENAWVVSSNWKPKLPYLYEYDIGAIKLSKNEFGQEVGDVFPGFDIELRTDKDPGYEKGKTEWKIIGYKVESTEYNDYFHMYESIGTFLDLEENKTTGGYLVIRNNPIYKGMSGSPWLLKNATNSKFEKSNGNVSAFCKDEDVVTPFYTKELIDDILEQLN